MSERLALPVVPMSVCPVCGVPEGGEHDDDCTAEEHALAEAGDPEAQAAHESAACWLCLAAMEVKRDCRCGKCCASLILEASAFDARREPLIRERGSPLDGRGEIPLGDADWLLNGSGGACVFLEADGEGKTRCGIYATRPVMCRLYRCEDCGKEAEDEL